MSIFQGEKFIFYIQVLGFVVMAWHSTVLQKNFYLATLIWANCFFSWFLHFCLGPQIKITSHHYYVHSGLLDNRFHFLWGGGGVHIPLCRLKISVFLTYFNSRIGQNLWSLPICSVNLTFILGQNVLFPLTIKNLSFSNLLQLQNRTKSLILAHMLCKPNFHYGSECSVPSS